MDDLQLVSVQHSDAGGFVLAFNEDPGVDAIGKFLWPSGVPSGVAIADEGSAKFHLTGLSIDALQSMQTDAANRISEASVLTAEPSDPSGAHGGTPPAGHAPRVEMDETTRARVIEVTKEILDGGHVFHTAAEMEEFIARSVENVADEGGAVADVAGDFAAAAETVAEVAGPIAAVALVVWVGFEVVEAFTSEKRLEEQQGFAYGVMWEALGEPDHIPKFVDGITYSADEHREAFMSGVSQGREKGRDPKTKGRIQLAVAVLGSQSGFGDYYAAGEILSDLWRHGREHSPGDSDTDTIPWPAPPDRGFF
jgi:hypothetical protein